MYSVKGHNIELGYLGLMGSVLYLGEDCSDRTGTGTMSIFGAQIKHDFDLGFPLLTTKKVFWRGVVEELLWILRGETNIKSLVDKNIHIWDQWADENGELGPVYGKQWRDWDSNQLKLSVPELGSTTSNLEAIRVDQIRNVIKRIKENPNCRRLIVSAWNPAQVDQMALPPCHCFFQFRVYSGKLYCQLYQRSADLFLGVPFNIASYALLTHIIANICDLEVGGFIHSFGDAHIYKNHFEQVEEQITNRLPKELPKLKIKRKFASIDDNISFDDFELVGYDPHPAIKGEVSV